MRSCLVTPTPSSRAKDFADIKGADIEKGTLNGVPSVMPGMWGDHLGVVDLVLNNDSRLESHAVESGSASDLRRSGQKISLAGKIKSWSTS